MNEYAKEGKKFLKAIDDYFKEFEKVDGYPIRSVLARQAQWPDTAPNPIKIIDSMDSMLHTGGKDRILYIRGLKGFDGYCTFLDSDDKFTDKTLRVAVSDMGTWQTTLLLVMATHVMPLYWHACYMRWQPIFCDKDLQKLRKTRRQFSALINETYEFLPKYLPTEPAVMPIEEGRAYQTSFYVFSDFGGYRKAVSSITFPSTHFALVKDIEINTEIEVIVPYRAHVML